MLQAILILSLFGYFFQLFFKKGGPSSFMGAIMVLCVWYVSQPWGIVFLVFVAIVFIFQLLGAFDRD